MEHDILGQEASSGVQSPVVEDVVHPLPDDH
jgi:hypothetical protein